MMMPLFFTVKNPEDEILAHRSLWSWFLSTSKPSPAVPLGVLSDLGEPAVSLPERRERSVTTASDVPKTGFGGSASFPDWVVNGTPVTLEHSPLPCCPGLPLTAEEHLAEFQAQLNSILERVAAHLIHQDVPPFFESPRLKPEDAKSHEGKVTP